MTKRDQPAMRRRLDAEGRCRICRSSHDVHVHHIVPRRVTQCDETENLVPLCARCHNDVHDHKLDLLGALTPEEQAKAVLLTRSIESARMLLCPSAYRPSTYRLKEIGRTPNLDEPIYGMDE